MCPHLTCWGDLTTVIAVTKTISEADLKAVMQYNGICA